jgi:hypothetical protein
MLQRITYQISNTPQAITCAVLNSHSAHGNIDAEALFRVQALDSISPTDLIGRLLNQKYPVGGDPRYANTPIFWFQHQELVAHDKVLAASWDQNGSSAIETLSNTSQAMQFAMIDEIVGILKVEEFDSEDISYIDEIVNKYGYSTSVDN